MVAEKLQNYFGLPAEFSSPETSKVVIVPCPYEPATSHGKGTKHGPKAILEASQQIELFDDELWTESHKIGISSHNDVKLTQPPHASDEPFQELVNVVSPLIEIDKFPIIIGGEHSLSLGPVRACTAKYPDLSILQIDAHAGLRTASEGVTYSHASIGYHMYQALPNPIVTTVGVRNISKEEVIWLESEEPMVNIFWVRQKDRWNFHEIVNTLSDNVYLTIDVDALDPSVMPSTNSPEPGGMTWYELVELVKVLCIRKNVVAADIVELSPISKLPAPDFLVAKLLYKLIGYRFALDLGVTKKYL